jgi:hypothetical protein
VDCLPKGYGFRDARDVVKLPQSGHGRSLSVAQVFVPHSDPGLPGCTEGKLDDVEQDGLSGRVISAALRRMAECRTRLLDTLRDIDAVLARIKRYRTPFAR